MSRDDQHLKGVIGPNAILQLLPVLDQLTGFERRTDILARAGVYELPDGNSMIPETHAAGLHRQLRLEEPGLAPDLAALAGARTGDYILAHRIPAFAQQVLKALPAGSAAWLLSKAIAKHAWTFTGSGEFAAATPWIFEIRNNPLVKGEHSTSCLCHWHAAVFETLYRALVQANCTCREVTCTAQGPGECCRFEILRTP